MMMPDPATRPTKTDSSLETALTTLIYVLAISVFSGTGYLCWIIIERARLYQ